MKKKIKITAIILLSLLIIGLIHLFTHVPKLSDKHGVIEAKLYLGSDNKQPLFVGFGEGVWFGKVIPSVLSALAAFCTAWIQLRKPHELWAIYRNAQRQIEIQITHFEFSIGEFEEKEEKLDFIDWLKLKNTPSLSDEIKLEKQEIEPEKNNDKEEIERIPIDPSGMIEAEMHQEMKASADPLDSFISSQITRKKRKKN